jgi:hypothetical protein
LAVEVRSKRQWSGFTALNAAQAFTILVTNVSSRPRETLPA